MQNIGYEEIKIIYQGLQSYIKTRIPNINKAGNLEIIDTSIKVILEKLAELDYRIKQLENR